MTKIVILGEARNKHEAKINSCFVGSSGAELLRMLAESGIIRMTQIDRDYINQFYRAEDPRLIDAIWALHPDLHRTNVFQQYPPSNDIEYFCGPKSEAIPGYPALLKSKYVSAKYEFELDRLADELLRHNPNLVICLGNTALWAMAGKTGITKLRGTTLLSTHTAADFKLLPTYHPAAVLRQWELRPTTVADFMKAKREAEYDYIKRPPREIWIEPTIDDIRTFRDNFIIGCELLSVDIETSGTRITCIGFSPSPDRALVVPFDDARTTNGSYWPTLDDERKVWQIVRGILNDRSVRKVFQNGAYDISFLWKAYGIQTFGAEEDTMLLQHALQPEALKSLGYLGSIYSDEGSWKDMRKKSETIKRDD